MDEHRERYIRRMTRRNLRDSRRDNHRSLDSERLETESMIERLIATFIERMMRFYIPIIIYSVQEPAASCSICLMEYIIGEELRRMPCIHKFHRLCLEEWLRLSDSCPICRSSVRSYILEDRHCSIDSHIARMIADDVLTS